MLKICPKNTKLGFTSVELLIAIVAVILISLTGYYIYSSKHRKITPITTVSSVLPNPYKDWKSYTLKNEKASFKYPDDWLLKDNSANGQDSLQVDGPTSFTVDITAAVIGQPGSALSQDILLARTINFLGQNGYLDYFNNLNQPAIVVGADLSTSNNDLYDLYQTKNISGNFEIEASYTNQNIALTLDQAKADKNYNDFYLLVKSFKY